MSLKVLETVMSHLKQRQRRRRRLEKNDLFCKRNSRTLRSVQHVNGSNNLLRLNMQRQCTVPNGNAKT